VGRRTGHRRRCVLRWLARPRGAAHLPELAPTLWSPQRAVQGQARTDSAPFSVLTCRVLSCLLFSSVGDKAIAQVERWAQRDPPGNAGLRQGPPRVETDSEVGTDAKRLSSPSRWTGREHRGPPRRAAARPVAGLPAASEPRLGEAVAGSHRGRRPPLLVRRRMRSPIGPSGHCTRDPPLINTTPCRPRCG
jgi:hypothetical protein